MAERSRGVGVVVALVVLVALLAVGYLFRDRLLGGTHEPTEASPEVAAAAEAKLQQLRAGGDSVRLSGVEITSLLRYRAPAAALEMVHDPAVEIAGDTIRLTGRVPTDRLPSNADLEKIRLLLPDTANLVVRGTLQSRAPGEAALQLQGVEFAGVPIPPRYYPVILERLGRREEPGLDPRSVGFRLPPSVAGARLSDGYLVLTSAPE
jgi:hypothetical protein